MDFEGSKYYELNRILLLLVGLWPYDKSKFKLIKILILSSFFITCSAAMIAKIITSTKDMEVMLRTMSLAVPAVIIIVKYITFLLLPASIKKLMELVQNDWNVLKDAKELEIIQKYAHFGRLCTIIFSVFGYACVFGVLITIYIPSILDIVAPLNVSRKQKLPIEVEYFINEQKYFYAIFYHIYVTLILSITVILATETLYVSYVHHACGMFKIASYRLQHAFDQDALQISSFVRNAMIRTKIIAAIKIHKRALEFYDFLWSKLALSYFILILIGVISLSINLFRVFQAIVIVKNTDELLMSSICVAAHLIYIFCGNYAGQVFIDHSMEVHENVYDTQWYRVPLREQKLMLFILHRSMHSCKLITGGTFVLSLEGFTSVNNNHCDILTHFFNGNSNISLQLLATSISYFTVLSSVQN